jgi:hypothetical protein
VAKFVAYITFSDPDRVPEIRPRHRAYLKQLLDDGKLHESGPFVDGAGALIIYEAAHETEARAILAADPYSEANVLGDVQLREWNRVYPA